MTLKGTCESAYCLKMDNGSVNETSKSVTAPFKTSAEVSEKAIFLSSRLFVICFHGPMLELRYQVIILQ